MSGNDALIGATGFVGTTLLRQRTFGHTYRSTTIADIRGQAFNLVVCAGAPAQKWVANREPGADRHNIEHLIEHLQTISCRQFVLISTVDVFQTPIAVTEDSAVDEVGLHPYGTHRRMLEKFVEARFPASCVIRLPGLVGPGLRKNVIFDLLNHNNLASVDSRSVFQFYPMVNLWFDIQTALSHRLSLVHLTAEPICVAEVAALGFGRTFEHTIPSNTPATYDFRSRCAARFGGDGHYQYSRRESIQAIRAYAQSEPIALMSST